MVSTLTLPSIFNDLRNDPFLVGFDQFFDRVGSRVVGTAAQATSYPPYNIVRRGEDEFAIEIALAGYSEDNLQVTVQEDTLTVKCIGRKIVEKDYVHRGIAKRSFVRKWTLSPTIIVSGASFTNGLLSIDLVNEIPEAKKPRTININNGTAGDLHILNE